mmetsp:Transcript_30469/g.86937  ORF Transcript_30469/g.86937 Transcript_30469/m.86937 type:complete len:218 (-) Transcript_30469:648-1301(-)
MQLVDELRVVHIAGVVHVQHLEDQVHVVVVDVHGANLLREVLLLIVAPPQLLETQAAVAVRIQPLAHFEEANAGVFAELVLPRRDLPDRHGLDLRGLIDHEAQKQVERRKAQIDRHEEEEDRCFRAPFHERRVEIAPALAHTELLAQGQHRRLHRGERTGAPLAIQLRPIALAVQFCDNWVDEQRSEHTPEAEDRCQQHHTPCNGPCGDEEALHHHA